MKRIPSNELLSTEVIAIEMAKAHLAATGKDVRKDRKNQQKNLSRLATGLRREVAEEPYLSEPERDSLADSAKILERLVMAAEMAKQELKHLMPASEHHGAQTLGVRLRHRRKALNWTQTYLAERVGTSQAVIQKIENGKSLRPRLLTEIASALGVRPAWLQFGVAEQGALSDEAIEVALVWSKLAEPHRTAMRTAILRMADARDRSSPKVGKHG